MLIIRLKSFTNIHIDVPVQLQVIWRRNWTIKKFLIEVKFLWLSKWQIKHVVSLLRYTYLKMVNHYLNLFKYRNNEQYRIVFVYFKELLN